MTVKDELRREHYGMSYSMFLKMVCDGCKNPCWLGEEHCDKLTRMKDEYGF